jgi:hypothetical protein
LEKGATTLSITTLNIMTFSITTFGIMTVFIKGLGLYVTLSINDTKHNNAIHCAKCRYAECSVLLIVMLNVIMLTEVAVS